MSFPPFNILCSQTLILPDNNIDTDQIIPARFLTITTKSGLGQYAFYDWRYDSAGQPLKHILNTSKAQTCQILIAGHNFGCGSSREHAPWALYDYGLRVIISSEIADIFKSNALKNGILPIVIDKENHQELLEKSCELEVDLQESCVRVVGKNLSFAFQIDPFSKYCLLNGLDEMSYLTQQTDEIAAFEANRPKTHLHNSEPLFFRNSL